MLIEDELKGNAPNRDTWLSIGVFDGVHLGHRHLIERLLENAAASGALSGIITFKQHPRQVISPETSITYLTTLDERIGLLRGQGVDFVVPLTFTPEVAQLAARDFVALLQKHLHVKGLVVGPNFALGKGRSGDVAELQRLGDELGFRLVVVPYHVQGRDTVSSTAIRNALASGDMASVNRMLGRTFSLSGPVVSGDERGRLLGFPTANVKVKPDTALPGDGVYVSRAIVGDRGYASVTNVGRRPTFGGGERTIEVFLLEFSGDLYQQQLRIELLDRLRAEKRFDSPDELRAQIAQDVERARSLLAEAAMPPAGRHNQ
ncbi:MAG: bifunctional riboflavin kinase/FAD synthetase [Chloroflexi bacterium]|nr:bifunctional riboflavin kinase/FAD synthetase [Chloroflexota bacterium]